MTNPYICALCKKELNESETYEYRGFYSCSEHFQQVIDKVDWKRQEIIEDHQAKCSGVNWKVDLFSDSVIAKANREIFKGNLEIISKETFREKEYRDGKL